MYWILDRSLKLKGRIKTRGQILGAHGGKLLYESYLRRNIDPNGRSNFLHQTNCGCSPCNNVVVHGGSLRDALYLHKFIFSVVDRWEDNYPIHRDIHV